METNERPRPWAKWPGGICTDAYLRIRAAWDATISPMSEVARAKNAAELVATARRERWTRHELEDWLAARELEIKLGLEAVYAELARLEQERAARVRRAA